MKVSLIVCWMLSVSDARKVSEDYLNALTGQGSEGGRELLLGGATMNAQLFNLENWKIIGEDPVRVEESDLPGAIKMMSVVDRTGHAAMRKLLGEVGVGKDLSVRQLSREEAAQLLSPTKEQSKRFAQQFPLLSYVARVDKEVYWHPQNPVRPMLALAGSKGKYTLEVYRFKVLSVEGPRREPREWPLRVIRFKTQTIDTGYKVLPASDWNAE